MQLSSWNLGGCSDISNLCISFRTKEQHSLEMYFIDCYQSTVIQNRLIGMQNPLANTICEKIHQVKDENTYCKQFNVQIHCRILQAWENYLIIHWVQHIMLCDHQSIELWAWHPAHWSSIKTCIWIFPWFTNLPLLREKHHYVRNITLWYITFIAMKKIQIMTSKSVIKCWKCCQLQTSWVYWWRAIPDYDNSHQWLFTIQHIRGFWDRLTLWRACPFF
jgi:hypothetical protein